MALTVNTNVTSLNVQKNLNKASDALSTSMTRMSPPEAHYRGGDARREPAPGRVLAG